MALLTKKEFADECGMQSNGLSVYITRRKVILGANDLIDTSNEINRAFLDKRKGRLTEQEAIAHVKTFGNPEIEPKPAKRGLKSLELPDTEEGEGGIPSLTQSERKLKFLDTQKREKEITLLGLREEKIKGSVIPSELVKPLFLQHNQSIITAFKNGGEEMLRRITKVRDLTAEENAQLKADLVEIINNAVQSATAATVNSIELLIKDLIQKNAAANR